MNIDTELHCAENGTPLGVTATQPTKKGEVVTEYLCLPQKNVDNAFDNLLRFDTAANNSLRNCFNAENRGLLLHRLRNKRSAMITMLVQLDFDKRFADRWAEQNERWEKIQGHL